MESLNGKGFSLIECIIVIALISIMTTVAVPQYRDYLARQRLKGSTRQIYSDLLHLRMKAVSENRTMAMSFANGHEYIVFHDENDNGIIDAGEMIFSKTIHPAYYDVVIASYADYVPRFYSNGTALTGRIACNGSSGSKEIRISGAGRLKIM